MDDQIIFSKSIEYFTKTNTDSKVTFLQRTQIWMLSLPCTIVLTIIAIQS